MKVVSFRSYYYPEIAASMYLMQNLAEDMVKQGIEVELFVPTPSRGIDKEIREKYKEKKYEEYYDGKLKVHRFSMLPEGKNVFGRALRYVLLNMIFFIKGLNCTADVFFIDSTPPTQGIVAAWLKKLKKIPVVYNLEDIFPDSLVHTGISKKNSLAYKLGSMMERVTYDNADKIIAISEDFKDNIMKKGVPENKIEVVYNWVDEAAVHRIERKDNELFDIYDIKREKFYIAYCGNIGLTQNMGLLASVAEKLKGYQDIGFIIVGDGAYKNELEKIVHERNLSNIKMIPFQPYSMISNVFSLGDVGLIISKPGVANNSVPSKTWSYMAAEIPILASFDIESDLCNLLNNIKCGVCVDANDENGLVDSILRLKNNCPNTMGQNGRRYIDKYLSREYGTSRYIDIITKVSGNKK